MSKEKVKLSRKCLAREFAIRMADALGYPISVSDDQGLLAALEAAPVSLGFAEQYLLTEVLSKADFLELGIDRKASAAASFSDAEEACRLTNLRVTANSTPIFPGVDAGDFKLVARRKISQLLGDFSWDEAERYFDFGPGANVGIPRARADRPNKIGLKRPTVTPGCLVLGNILLRRFDLWNWVGGVACIPEVVAGNKIVTVPKNYKTERTIAIEPLLNSVLQKGIGAVIRKRLLRAGQNLNDQDRNGRLARLGSVSGVLATLDLKAASDTLALELVRELLPADWLRALELTRSECGVVPSGTVVRYQKFSSMGNGYTFELESLIFWAICETCRDFHRVAGSLPSSPHPSGDRDTVSVYGDDIVVPDYLVDSVTAALTWAGFTLNKKKSFVDDCGFRESCGKHFFRGRDVTPLYVRKNVAHPERIIWLANSVKRLAFRMRGLEYSLDGRLESVHSWLVSQLPPFLRRPALPDGYGDGALLGDFDEVCPSKARSGLEGYVTRTTVRVFAEKSVDEEDSFVSDLFSRDRLIARGGTAAAGGFPIPEHKYRLRRVPLLCPQWQNLGPWI